MLPKRLIAIVMALGASLALPAGHAQAQSYPERTVRILVPYAPGGYTDVLARLVAARLQATMGQAFIVENKPGAATALAAETVANAPADGYTLLFTATTTTSINPHVLKNMRYRVDQFVPVAMVSKQPFMLVASHKFAPNTMQELLAHARANPGRINWATQGQGASSHLVGELVKSLAKVDFNTIHYKGSAPANVDIMAGIVDIHFDGVGTALPNIAGGRLKAIGVTSEKRLAAAPNIPTLVESGLPGAVAYSWFGMLAPAATPPAIVARLNAEIVRWMQEKDVTARLEREGAEVVYMSPAEFGRMIAAESEVWRKVIEPLNLKLD